MGQGSAFSLLLRNNKEQRCREGEFSHEEYKVKKNKKQPGSVRLASLGGSSRLTGPFSETESQRFEGS